MCGYHYLFVLSPCLTNWDEWPMYWRSSVKCGKKSGDYKYLNKNFLQIFHKLMLQNYLIELPVPICSFEYQFFQINCFELWYRYKCLAGSLGGLSFDLLHLILAER